MAIKKLEFKKYYEVDINSDMFCSIQSSVALVTSLREREVIKAQYIGRVTGSDDKDRLIFYTFELSTTAYIMFGSDNLDFIISDVAEKERMKRIIELKEEREVLRKRFNEVNLELETLE